MQEKCKQCNVCGYLCDWKKEYFVVFANFNARIVTIKIHQYQYDTDIWQFLFNIWLNDAPN